MTSMVHHVSSGQGMTEALGTEEPMLRTSVWTHPIVAMSQCAKQPDVECSVLLPTVVGVIFCSFSVGRVTKCEAARAQSLCLGERGGVW